MRPRRPTPTTAAETSPVSRYHALIAQAAHLRSPTRKDGPARGEAEEAAEGLEREAATLSESLFWLGADRAAREYPLLTPRPLT